MPLTGDGPAPVHAAAKKTHESGVRKARHEWGA
jgi:hypothetical protein